MVVIDRRGIIILDQSHFAAVRNTAFPLMVATAINASVVLAAITAVEAREHCAYVRPASTTGPTAGRQLSPMTSMQTRPPD